MESGKMKKKEEKMQKQMHKKENENCEIFGDFNATSVTISKVCRCCCNFFAKSSTMSMIFFGMCFFTKKINNPFWKVTVFL